MYNLSYKVARFFVCLTLKISLTTEPIRFSISGKLHIDPVRVCVCVCVCVCVGVCKCLWYYYNG